MPAFARYKHALSSFHVLDTIEAGLVLSGPEVKAVKAGNIRLMGSYISMEDDGLFLKNSYVGPYLPAKGAQQAYDPNRPRKLLVSKQQMIALGSKLQTKGLTMIPLSVYSKAGLVKVEMALVRGKSQTDKRELLKKKAVNLDIQRELKRR